MTSKKTSSVIKSPSLKKGEQVGLVSPSSRPHSQLALAKAKYILEQMGFQVKVGKHALATHGYTAGTDAQRAEDLNGFFADDSVKAIFCSTGGYGALRLLPLIDYDNIAKNPKLFCGSDSNVVINLALWEKLKLVTLHAPNLDDVETKYTYDCLQKALTATTPIDEIKVSHSENQGGNEDWPGLNFVGSPVTGNATGLALGGSLSSLISLMGTPYMPELKDAVLFLEDRNERSDVLDRWFINLDVADLLKSTSAIAFGHFANCGILNAENMLSVEELFADRLIDIKKISCFGFPIGKGPTTATVPLGLKCKLDTAKGEIHFLESACS